MLDGGVYHMKGSYSDFYRAFHLEGFLNASTEKKESSHETILKDLHRQSWFISSPTDQKELESRWRDSDPTYYSQGDMTGSAVPSTLPMFFMDKEIKPGKNIIQTASDLGGANRYIRKFSFGYLDKDKNVCGVSVCYLEEPNTKKRFWAISILHNANAEFDKREMELFTFFPEGWSQTAYTDEEKCKILNPRKVKKLLSSKFSESTFNKQLEKSLNSIPVYLYLEGLIDSTGSIKLDFLEGQRSHKFTAKDTRELLRLPESLEEKYQEKLKKQGTATTASTTPINPKPNANVTEFIKIPRIAAAINKAIADRGYVLSEDRHFLVNKNDQREILIGPKGEMTTDPINTAETPNPKATIKDIFIAMMRTYSIVFREGGEANFPSEKINLNFQQAKGASDEQKQSFLRLEADIRKGLVAEIEKNAKHGHYPDAFLNKITFNGMKLNTNPLKRPADNVESESAEETETASKRPRSSTR